MKGLMYSMKDYSEYLIQGEPNQHDRVRNWMTAIGLQDVDGLTPSNYILEAVHRNVEGEIAENSKYFCNALVRANYSNIQYGIKKMTEYMERFFRNLFLGEKNELKNRYMIIGTSWNGGESTQEILSSTQQTTTERIIGEIRKYSFTTRKQLAEVIGITPDSIKTLLDKLKTAGKIRHVGATKKGHWEIME